MRVKDVILSLMSVALIGAGIVLIVTFFLSSGSGGDSTSDEQQHFDVPVLVNSNTQAAEQYSGDDGESAPQDKTLWLTVPSMTRVFGGVAVPDAPGDDEEKLKDYAAIHLEGTGYPWEVGANVYIAGHRLGYPYTNSFLAFYDLNKLDTGDQVYLTDTDGRVYSYKVSERFFAGPTDLSIVAPVEGKDVLTLQTCTLPDYSQRLIVQAEKVV